MLSLRDLLTLWDFKTHPFETYTAENEPRLPEYFVEPPYLDDMVGSASSMAPAIVFGARGIGKSAIRIYIESLCTKPNPEQDIGGRAIAITYDDFTHALDDGIDKVSVEKHLEIIMNKIVGAALLTVANSVQGEEVSEDTIRKAFPTLDISAFGKLVYKYFSQLNELQKEKTLKGVYNYFRGETMSLYDRANWFQKLWGTLRAPIIDITNVILATRGKDLIQAVNIPAQMKLDLRDAEELINDLQAVASLTEQFGIDLSLIHI